jgi:hypothetical protein
VIPPKQQGPVPQRHRGPDQSGTLGARSADRLGGALPHLHRQKKEVAV